MNMIQSKEKNSFFILQAFLLSTVFAFFSHWIIFEYDLFFQVRAGKEILENYKVQTLDTWSYTAGGEPWFNFQWLSTVALYLLTRMDGGYEILGTLRSLLIFSWIFGLVHLLQKSTLHAQKNSFWLLPMVLIPWVYLICWFRLQMRPDLFATVFYIGFLVLWNAHFTSKIKKSMSLVLLLIWSNFHSGTVNLGILVFSLFVFFENGLPRVKELPLKCAWIIAGAMTLLLTPIGTDIFSVLWQIAFTYDYNFTGNPDMQPFSFKLLQLRHGGWSLLLWMIYTVVAFFSYLFLWNKQEKLPIFYRNKLLVVLVSLLLTVLTFKRIRVIHYQTAFLLPIVATGLVLFFSRMTLTRVTLLFSSLIFFWGFALPDQILNISKPIGRGIASVDLPVDSVSFIKKNPLKGKMYNAYAFGGYLVGELPDYLVSLDGREIPFTKYRIELAQARQNTETLTQFLKKQDVNFILETIPSMFYEPNAGFIDSHLLYYPPQDWALVFFDNASVLFVRRIPEHQSIIEKYEYRYIRRGLPANYAASYKGLSEEVRSSFEKEFNRCLDLVPRNTYCLVGKSAFFTEKKRLEESKILLEQALSVQPRSIEIVLELASVEEKLGNSKRAHALQKKFRKLANTTID